MTPALPPQASARSANPFAARTPRVLLSFDLGWDDAPLILAGISHYFEERCECVLDMEGSAGMRPDWISMGEWDGVITRHVSTELVQACRDAKIPLVDLHDSPRMDGVAKIRPDNHQVGQLGAEHLLARGFKRLGFYGTPEHWAKERRAGFVAAVEAAGRRASFVTTSDFNHTPQAQTARRDTLIEWLRLQDGPIGVMACNDLYALDVTHACRRLGLSVPGEIAVIGANDDITRCRFANPPLSSVVTNRKLAGYRAAETLETLMLSGSWTSELDLRVTPSGVVTRRSTDIMSVRDDRVRHAIEFIQAHACEGISVDDVVAHTRISRSVLERSFRSEIGDSPHALIRKAQLERVKHLLIHAEVPIKAIAGMVGVPHPEYLNVLFHRMTGMNPGEFRRLHRNTMVVESTEDHGE